jgi:hypothetical protein
VVAIILKDPMTTAAAIDRLVHHSVILEMTGPSVRAEAAEQARKEASHVAGCPESHGGQAIEWHPHVHLLVPGGALAPSPRRKPPFTRCPMAMNRKTQNQLPHRTMRNGQLYLQERLQAPMPPLPAHTSTLAPAFESSQRFTISLSPAPSQLPKR